MGLIAEELVKDIKRKDLETICYYLLNKREVDGHNGRMWDACEHMDWEDRLSAELKKHNYLGHTGQ